MKVYSKTIFSFIHKAEGFARDILKSEANITLKRSRFEIAGHTYPMHIIVFTGESKIGYFNPSLYQIGLNKNLIYTAKDSVIKDIIRHELAHYLTNIFYPDHILPHGEEFKSICKKYNWSEKISKASGDIEFENTSREGEIPQERILEKVKKLLTLSTSSNIHEASSATLKANELILKYNLQNMDNALQTEREIFVDVAIKAKRRNSKLGCIYDILKHFLVNPIFISSKEETAIEVSGSLESIELAKYISHYLDLELERLWHQTKCEKIKGMRAKNSFFMGIAKGYHQKMESFKDSCTPEMKKMLIKQQTIASEEFNQIYKRVRQSSSGSQINPDAFSKGKNKGKNLVVKPGLKNKFTTKLLNWR